MSICAKRAKRILNRFWNFWTRRRFLIFWIIIWCEVLIIMAGLFLKFSWKTAKRKLWACLPKKKAGSIKALKWRWLAVEDMMIWLRFWAQSRCRRWDLAWAWKG